MGALMYYMCWHYLLNSALLYFSRSKKSSLLLWAQLLVQQRWHRQRRGSVEMATTMPYSQAIRMKTLRPSMRYQRTHTQTQIARHGRKEKEI